LLDSDTSVNWTCTREIFPPPWQTLHRKGGSTSFFLLLYN
jgi:hypothetical protein